jgi:hypothetical protein
VLKWSIQPKTNPFPHATIHVRSGSIGVTLRHVTISCWIFEDNRPTSYKTVIRETASYLQVMVCFPPWKFASLPQRLGKSNTATPLGPTVASCDAVPFTTSRSTSKDGGSVNSNVCNIRKGTVELTARITVSQVNKLKHFLLR